jgi:paromamine 6'-oxidase/6'''-hydroxyneomycin C oxidase/2'-deamino-2'-hydroxyparomamine 6'-oxidase
MSEAATRSWTPNYGPEPAEPGGRVHADVCVIGSGASGSVVAAMLARAGLDVVVIEQGPYVDAETTYDDVVAASELAWIYRDYDVWEKIGWPWSTCNVGGGTVFYGGASFRHRAADHEADRYLGEGELPMRWPWSPAELDPFYTEVERMIGISGGGGDPGLPPGHRYPLPPVPRSAAGQVIADAALRSGLHPFHTPLAIASREYDGRAACTFDNACISNRCEVGARGDAFTVFLGPLLRERAVRLYAGLRAIRLVSSGRTHVSAVQCVRVDTGHEFEIHARHVVLAANAIQSAALLLRSVDRYSPAGVGNHNDLVGRGLCMKLSEYVVAYRRAATGSGTVNGRPHKRPVGPGPYSTVAVTDYYVADDAPGGLGGLIMEAKDEAVFPLRPDEQILRLECLAPDEPRLANRVTLGRGRDAQGLPDIVLEYQASPRDLARLEYVIERAEELLRAAGGTQLRREPSLCYMGSGHLHGTCRSGEDPRTSVTNPSGRLHSVDNVTIVDGALLPFPGAVNPTLTIQAVALRTAHQLLREGFDITPSEPAQADAAAARSASAR